MGEFAIGQPVPRFEDPRLIQGGGRYVADMVFPGTAHGYVLRSPHAHARIRKIDTAKAKTAPGVLAVITGADYKAAGFGDLPVPGGLKRRGDTPGYRPRYPALVEDRVRMIGDYVAFVVAETYYQAVDAAELIEIDYEALPPIVSTGDAVKPGVPLVWDDCPNNIGFIQVEGNKEATDAAFAKAAHVVKHHFVINRVTAATMEPRGCIGIFEPTEQRYTIYTTLQRTNVFQTELSQYVLKVPDNKIRVVCGDIGGSFGMKSAVYNEVALVLLAAKLTGRPVKWVATRSESFLCDAQARDNVTDAELALDKDGNFLGFRAKIIAAIGAYLQVGMPAFTGNLGTLAGVYRTPASHVDVTAVFTHTQPVRPYRGNGRPEAGYIIERMVDLAADQLGIDPAELRRRNTIPSSAMPYKTSVTFTYDCGEFEKNMDMALDAADKRGFEARRAASRKHGKLRGFGFSNTIERSAAAGLEGAEIRFDRTGSVSIFSGSINQGQGHETAFKQIVCDRLGLDPNEVTYIQGDTDQVFFAEGTGGSRSAAFSGSAFTMAAEKVEAKGKAIAAHMLKVDVADIKFADGVFSTPEEQSDADHQGSRQGVARSQKPAGRPRAGPDRKGDLHRQGGELSQRRPRLRARDRRDHGRRRDLELQRGRRRRHRDQSAVAARPDRRRHRHGRRANFDGRHQVRRAGPDPHRLVHGLRHAARVRPHRIPCRQQSGADQVQSARRQRRRRSRLRRRHAGGRQRAGRRALGARHQARRNAGDAGGAVARDP